MVCSKTPRSHLRSTEVGLDRIGDLFVKCRRRVSPAHIRQALGHLGRCLITASPGRPTSPFEFTSPRIEARADPRRLRAALDEPPKQNVERVGRSTGVVGSHLETDEERLKDRSVDQPTHQAVLGDMSVRCLG
jgi:hypothetical protein